jgi:hypothetical protein
VSRALQAGGLDLGLRQQLAGHSDRLVLVDGDLEAVLAGVARAGDEAFGAGDREDAAGHEGEGGHTRGQAGQCLGGLRALQRQQRTLWQRADLAAVADLRPQVRDVGILAAGIHHDEQVTELVRGVDRRAGDHQVVEDVALLVREEGVALLAGGQVDHVDRHQGFQRGGRIGADQAQLAHVGDVEQRGRIAALLVFGHQAGGVLHRHRVASEGHHAGAEFEVQGVQRGLQQLVGGGSGGHRCAVPVSRAIQGTVLVGSCPRCPLYLRD